MKSTQASRPAESKSDGRELYGRTHSQRRAGLLHSRRVARRQNDDDRHQRRRATARRGVRRHPGIGVVLRVADREEEQLLDDPIHWFADRYGTSMWRFILSHPDKDHLSGIRRLLSDDAKSRSATSGITTTRATGRNPTSRQGRAGSTGSGTWASTGTRDGKGSPDLSGSTRCAGRPGTTGRTTRSRSSRRPSRSSTTATTATSSTTPPTSCAWPTAQHHTCSCPETSRPRPGTT